jgi:hypothetical protein
MKGILTILFIVICVESLAQDKENYIMPEMALNDTLFISITSERGIYSFTKKILLIKSDEIFQVCYYSQDTTRLIYKVDNTKVPETKINVANEISECLNKQDEECLEKIKSKYGVYLDKPWYNVFYEFKLDSCEKLNVVIKLILIPKIASGIRFKADITNVSILYKDLEQKYCIKGWLDWNQIILE